MQQLLIITGHTSGLGRALIDLALKDGWIVMGLARRRIEEKSPKLFQIEIDLADPQMQWQKLADSLQAYGQNSVYDRVVLVNNAGDIKPVGLLGTLDPLELKQAMHLNVLIPTQLINWLVSQYAHAKLTLAQISSGAARKAYEGWASYCLGKSAMKMLAEVFAAEASLSGKPRSVIVYEPGVIDTPMQTELRRQPESQFPQVQRFRELKDSGQLITAAESAAFLWRLLERNDLGSFHEERFRRSYI